MLAVRIEKFGPPSELQLREIPQPKPGPDEVLVRVHAAAINPSDVKNVAGKFHQTILPRTPGRDFSGVVEETGQQIWSTGGEIGFTQDGAHAEYVLIHKGAIRPKPAALNMEQAAAIGTPFSLHGVA